MIRFAYIAGLLMLLTGPVAGQVVPGAPATRGAATQPASQPSGLRFRAHPPNGPELVVAAARSRLPPAGRGVPVPSRVVVTDLESKTIKRPLPTYNMTLADVSGRTTLDQVRTTVGFLYYVDDATGQTQAAMNVSGDDRAAVRVAMTEFGPRAERYARAMTQLETLPEIQAGEFEPRLLRFGATSVIWLKDLAGNADLIYPLPPANPNDPPPAGLTVEKLITAEQLIRVLTSQGPPRGE